MGLPRGHYPVAYRGYGTVENILQLVYKFYMHNNLYQYS